MRFSSHGITRIGILLSCLCLLGGIQELRAQSTFGNMPPGMQGLQQGMQGGQGSKHGAKDSLHHRTGLEDTLTLTYRYMDSTHIYKLDTSVDDFDKFYPLPANYNSLGNIGTASKPIFFQPNLQPGWDAGFHSFDVYRLTWDNTKFYTTTRPYTNMEYLLGSANEQDIDITHTQNINQFWNFAFRYRLSGGPGVFKSLKGNDNNYSLYTWYVSPKKRYHIYAGFIYNNLKSEENGGFYNNSLLDSSHYNQRFIIPTNIGGNTDYQSNIFNTELATGTHYTEFSLMIRNQYDLGQQDSVIVNDSTTYYLFYSRLRMQHTLQVNSYTYSFLDNSPDSSTHFYHTAYDFLSTPLPGFLIEDKWSQILNDFSLYQYPEAKNPSQYLMEGITLENLKGTFSRSTNEYYNVYAHGEYRNQTRNKKWDIDLHGKLYLEGYNFGNYEAYASLGRTLGKKIGYLQLGFQNVNRSASFVYQTESSFNFAPVTIPPLHLKSENTTHLFGTFWQPLLKLKLEAHYYLMNNYSYIQDYYHPAQYATLFNLLQVSVQKQFHLSRHWDYYGDYYLQQVTGDAPVHVPLFYTRNRLIYEGRFYRKLNLALGLEAKYASPYKEDMYSPLLGQFFPQSQVIYGNRPEISAFVHFRIRTFYLVARAENLNTLNISPFGFTANNKPFVNYADPGLIIHFGVAWGFIN
jgi:hypothetical protein